MTTRDQAVKPTAVLLIDPYNDFLSEGGKLAAAAKPVADAVHTLANMRAVVAAARAAGARPCPKVRSAAVGRRDLSLGRAVMAGQRVTFGCVAFV